ncbi:MAG: hypothetical protein GC202_02230 [Alphaproteobacteria bacterium]|nr:hypothetical protein [Alphaproteobacteria bacterium]
MTDLVGTCPKDFWPEWIAEGDAVGAPESGEEWGWFTRHSLIRQITTGDRFYVVAHGKLRGYAPVTRVTEQAICRRTGAVACTIDERVPGFRGLRERWWSYADEKPFPSWRTDGVISADIDALAVAFEAHKDASGKFTRRKVIKIADLLGTTPKDVVLGCELTGLIKSGSWDWFVRNGGITKAHLAEIRADRAMETANG